MKARFKISSYDVLFTLGGSLLAAGIFMLALFFTGCINFPQLMDQPENPTTLALSNTVGHTCGFAIGKRNDPKLVETVETLYKEAKATGNAEAFSMLLSVVAVEMKLNPYHIGPISTLVRIYGGRVLDNGQIVDIGEIPAPVLGELEAGWRSGILAAAWERERGI